LVLTPGMFGGFAVLAWTLYAESRGSSLGVIGRAAVPVV